MSPLKEKLHGARRWSVKSFLIKWQFRNLLKEFTRGRESCFKWKGNRLREQHVQRPSGRRSHGRGQDLKESLCCWVVNVRRCPIQREPRGAAWNLERPRSYTALSVTFRILVLVLRRVKNSPQTHTLCLSIPCPAFPVLWALTIPDLSLFPLWLPRLLCKLPKGRDCVFTDVSSGHSTNEVLKACWISSWVSSLKTPLTLQCEDWIGLGREERQGSQQFGSAVEGSYLSWETLCAALPVVGSSLFLCKKQVLSWRVRPLLNWVLWPLDSDCPHKRLKSQRSKSRRMSVQWGMSRGWSWLAGQCGCWESTG